MLLEKKQTVENFCKNQRLQQLIQTLNVKKNDLKDFKTAALWLQYLEMVELLHTFIKAERTGNWSLHLQCIHSMLPYFASAGHNLYAKSAYIYLQSMLDLEKTHPDIHTMFSAGHHVLRRSERFWAGLSTDLVIEQVLMRSIKTSGDLTRGRGMNEIQ